MGDGPRLEMYLYVADLHGVVKQFADADVTILREPETWGGADRDGR
jgi:hypothetical protein